MGSKPYENKTAIIGTGMVGASLAYAMCLRGTCHNLALIDKDEERAKGEAMDLNHSLSLLRPMTIESGGYELCQGADVVVITAGAAQKEGETRLDLAGKNAAIVKEIAAEVMEHNPRPLFLVVTNPVDVLTYVVLKESSLEPHRVIGSGTVLDSSRFRFLLSRHCRVDPRNMHAYIAGEHGDSAVALWSQVHVAGVRLAEYCLTCDRGCPTREREEIFEDVRDAAYEVIKRKGATYYAIGVALVKIIEAVLGDQHRVLTVSSLIEGYSGIDDVCLSVPGIVGREGVERIIRAELPETERKGLQDSASVLRESLSSLGY